MNVLSSHCREFVKLISECCYPENLIFESFKVLQIFTTALLFLGWIEKIIQ